MLSEPTKPTVLSVLERELGQMRLIAATEEMSLALQRASRSLYVRETADFACAVADASGRFVAYPQGIGVSGFVGLDVSEAVRVVREREGLEPGDVILTNDPYTSGALSTHLPDVHAIAPYFEGEEVVGYGWTFIHVSDVGGRVPSSVSVRNDSIFAEGLRIPPVKYVAAGRRVPGVEALLRANSRAAEQNDGDLAAMLAALDRGRARVAEVVADHPGGLAQIGEHARAQTAARARRALGRLADGGYRFEDYLDNDAVSDLPLRIALRATVAGGTLDLDFTGTDPQVEAALNMVTQGRAHSWVLTRMFALVGTLDPDVPLNGGLMDVVTFRAPEGSVLNAVAPAAVGVRHATVSRVNDVVSGALVQAAPDVLPAASSGLVVPVVFAPRASGPGKNLQVVEPMVGGTGARRGADGIDGRDSGISNLANNPVETVEASIGVRVLRYAVRPDSAGPGRWRGGSGLELVFEALEPGTLLARGLERTRFQPWGAAGGGPGACTELIVNEGRDGEQRLVVVDTVPLEVGDTVTLRTAGAGGYGDPFLRAPQAVLADVLGRLISVGAAARDYGVVVSEGLLDEAATAALRSAPRDERAWWGRGAARDRWDAVFDRDLLDHLDVALRGLAPLDRAPRRRALLHEVLTGLPDGFPRTDASAAALTAARARATTLVEALAGATPAV
ncbi:hydantoinase B/oxoprolinase family protein [Litorihabitans aurantiacus]|uniref:Hydantoinase B/oxoprolinase n=1 Tax=Litorihabitans aurantiacus TaxID=1930061 RepID=A0AA38CWJ9_9MICO|nr:hydantoinase B/oxoprolinase family protein [Litorihabitans aurantiacus]GMA33162.1 hydantoinase B/oxoprolinase [Litorihabitans aurantiacus]